MSQPENTTRATSQGQPPPPPGYGVGAPDYRDDEINLLDLWRVLVKRKNIVGIITAVCGLLAVTVALMQTPVYRAEVLLLPVEGDQKKGGLGGIASQFGGLASLAGIDIGGASGNRVESVATLKSRVFVEAYIAETNLLPVLYADQWDAEHKRWRVDDDKIPTVHSAFKLFKDGIMSVQEDKKSGLITLSVEWKDREATATWANELVSRANDYMRARAADEAQRSIEYLNHELEKSSVVGVQQAIYRLIESHVNTIMLANVNKEFAFKVVDPAVVPQPQDKVKPKRSLIVVLGLMAGLMLGLFLVFVLEAVQKMKEQEKMG